MSPENLGDKQNHLISNLTRVLVQLAPSQSNSLILSCNFTCRKLRSSPNHESLLRYPQVLLSFLGQNQVTILLNSLIECLPLIQIRYTFFIFSIVSWWQLAPVVLKESPHHNCFLILRKMNEEKSMASAY